MKFELQNVSVHYDSIPALSGVTCTISSGATLLLSGSTGAGKTTFLRLLYGDIRAYDGQVFIDGNESRSITKRQLRKLRMRMGIIFQDTKLIPHLTLYENVIAPLVIAGHSKRASDKRCLELMSQLGISYLRDKFPEQISGGEKQLAGLCRAIIHRPDSIIADEPTANVDTETVERITSALKFETARGATLIVASHDPTLIAHLHSSPHVTLSEGCLVAATNINIL